MCNGAAGGIRPRSSRRAGGITAPSPNRSPGAASE
jgi:hypothetical protein